MSKEKSKSHTQWVPSFIYWNLRLLSQRWESPQTQLISEALVSWMSKHGLKTKDYFEENPQEITNLIISNEGQRFRDKTFSLKGLSIRGVSITKGIWLNLQAASLQTKRPMSAILVDALVNELEALGWVFLSETTAKKECLETYSRELTGEYLDSSEPVEEDNKFDKLFLELETQNLLDSRKSYTYDDLLAIKAEQREKIVNVPEADEIIQRIKKELNKEGQTNE